VITRRRLLLGAAGVAAGCATAGPSEAGTTDWILRSPPTPPDVLRQPLLEGYCSRTSVKAGESVEFMLSAAEAGTATIDLYRMGYYGGRGGTQVARLGPFRVSRQPDPPVGEERLRECRWEPTASFRVPSDWRSGVYLGKLRGPVESYVIFIVRDDRPCDFLFQCSDTTWAAYNRWPDLWSLYDDGTPPHHWYTGPGVRVSFDRPYGKYRQILDAPLSQGSGEFLLWEFPLAFWMEEQGYDVSYISNLDTHSDPATLLRAKAFLSVGHDEYWSLEMYENVRAAIAAGVNAAFLSGNSVDGRIEVLPNAKGVPGRAIGRIGKFGGERSPRDRSYAPRWKAHGPDPALLMGARTTNPANGGADWTCVKPDHWLFEGTGMKAGDSIPGLVGWEHHGEPAAIPGLEVLARGRVMSGKRDQGVDYTATIHPGPKGNHVFNAATCWWSDGLSAPPGYLRPTSHGNTPPGPDRRVRRITQNLFRRFLA
jgi:hypothetical protein